MNNKANRKSQKLSSLAEMARSLSNVSNPFKIDLFFLGLFSNRPHLNEKGCSYACEATVDLLYCGCWCTLS